MRDLVVLLFCVISAVTGFICPWIGVLALAVLAYLNPHRYAWGFSRSLPVYLVVFLSTLLGLLFTRDRQRFPWTRETALFVTLLAYFTFTTFWNPDFSEAATDQWVKVMKIYAGIFPTLWLITSKDRLRWLLMTIALSFGLIGLKGGLFALARGFQYRVLGPDNTFYGENNEIGLALNMTLPLLMLSAQEAKGKWLKILFYSSFVLSVFSVISTWSRGGLLALCAVLIAMILTGKRKWLSIPVLIVAITLSLPRLPEKWLDRMQTIKDYQDDGSALARLDSWQFAFDRALKNPLTGGGFACFSERTDSHSAYFQIMAHHGFLALGIWLSLLFGTIIALERLRKQATHINNAAWIRRYARTTQISLLGYSVGAAFLGAAYWDIFYHLIAVCSILKVQLLQAQTIQETSGSTGRLSAIPPSFHTHPSAQG